MFFFSKRQRVNHKTRASMRHVKQARATRGLFLLFLRKEVLSFFLAFLLVSAAPERRILHVSLYPYIPEPASAALYLKQAYEDQHPDVLLDVSFNPHYYSLDPADHGVLYEEADVHTIDIVFLRDFLSRHKLAPLPPGFFASLPRMEALAQQAATISGVEVAVPQWMCADFLFYRADATDLAGVDSLKGLEKGLHHRAGLLMDMSGPDTIGELIFSILLSETGSPEAALARVSETPDPAIVQRLRRFLALEPRGFGRVPDYGARYSFYARQFARRAGTAFVGYSEMTNEVLNETQTSCRLEERCVTAAEIRVAAIPFHDGPPHPAIWVDMFGIDAGAKGQKYQDAVDFIRFAVSLPTYRALLVPPQGEPPRYLLPSTVEAFDDPDILKAAPLYPKFRAMMEQGVVSSLPNLQSKLHAVATRVDDLLRTVQ
jgi:thiamine pyridinylase